MDIIAFALGLSIVGSPAAATASLSLSYHGPFATVDYSWSKEAAEVPQLVKLFRAGFEKEKSESIRCGKEESAIRIKTGGMAIRCESSTKITTSGSSERLLVLARQYWAFTGGAHGNGATTPLVWDRRLGKEISSTSLFLPGGGYQAVFKAPYCRALDRERKKRRGDDYQPGMVTEFDTCPKFSELALIPGSSSPGLKLDTMHLIAAPYVAGPYVEGEYDIALPVTKRLIATIKPEYRSSFQVQRAQ